MGGVAKSIGTIAGGALGFAVGGPAGATLGAGIGGSLGGVIDGSNAADKYEQEALQRSRDSLAFAKQQYADWHRIFGPIEQNLSRFYQNLSPEIYAREMKNDLTNQYNINAQNMMRTLNQKHIDDSGLAVEALKDMNQDLAARKALADTKARDIVENKKLGFLNAGLGNQNAVAANVMNANNSLSNLAGNLASTYNQQVNNSLGNIGSTIGLLGSRLFSNEISPLSAAASQISTAGLTNGVLSGISPNLLSIGL
jgi:hypothetical protein